VFVFNVATQCHLSSAELRLCGDNWEYTKRKRNHFINARAPKKPEGYRVNAPWLEDLHHKPGSDRSVA